MKTRNHLLIVVVLLFSAMAPPLEAQAPPGWRTFTHKQTGVKLFHPKEFKVIPVKPDEHLILAKFERPTPWRAKKKDRTRRPEFFLAFVLEDSPQTSQAKSKERPLVMGSGQSATGDRKKDKVTSFADIEKRRNAIHTWQDFLKKRYRGRFSTRPTKTRLRKGEQEYTLHIKQRNPKAQGDNPAAGMLFIRRTDSQTWGIMGFCDQVVAKSFHKIFRKIARSMDKPKGFVRVRDDSAKFYENKKLKGIPFRIKARRAMVKGWKATDTENFFVLYHTTNMRLVHKIVSDLEAIQPFYQKMFPPVEGTDAISVVRICRNVKEYLKYGGPVGSAGYWNPAHQELVFYDASRDSRAKSKRQAERDSYLVLYHEGFHQFIFNGLEGVSPDYWFNEGMADYFGGSVFYRGSKRMKEIMPNRWRIPRIKGTVNNPKAWLPLDRLIKAKRPDFYNRNPQIMSQMYAQSWALCYFLLRSSEAAKHEGWREIIPNYYKALKVEAARVKKAIDMSKRMKDEMSLQDKMKQYSMAGTRATRAAFSGIDMKLLEETWKQWVRTMKDPWAAKRPKRKK